MNLNRIILILLLLFPVVAKSQDSLSVRLKLQREGDKNLAAPRKFPFEKLTMGDRMFQPAEIFINDSLYVIGHLTKGMYVLSVSYYSPYSFFSMNAYVALCAHCNNTVQMNYQVTKPGGPIFDEGKVFIPSPKWIADYHSFKTDFISDWNKKQKKIISKKKFTITGFLIGQQEMVEIDITGDALKKRDKKLILKSLARITNWKNYMRSKYLPKQDIMIIMESKDIFK